MKKEDGPTGLYKFNILFMVPFTDDFGDFLDMDAPLLTVDSLNLAFSGFKASSHDLYDITFTNRDGTDFVLGL